MITDLRPKLVWQVLWQVLLNLQKSAQLLADDSKKKDETEVPSPADTEVSPISKVILNIAKNRNGRTGIVEFEFDKPHCHFEIPDLSMEDILNDN